MKRKDLLIILASIFMFVVFWVGFNIYHASVKSTISESVNMQISPLSADFDTKTIDKLKKRQSITPVFQNTTAPPQDTPGLETSTIAPPQSSTGSAVQATSGGSLLQ